MNIIEKQLSATQHFMGNPDAKKYFVTSDGLCFPGKDDAHNHSLSLEDKDVLEINRSEVISEGTSGNAESVINETMPAITPEVSTETVASSEVPFTPEASTEAASSEAPVSTEENASGTASKKTTKNKAE
jgi:hypothetical protein